MNAQMINSNDELSLEQLDDVNGGAGWLAWLYEWAAEATFGESMEEISETIDQTTGSGVVARKDGTDDTGYNPNNPFGK